MQTPMPPACGELARSGLQAWLVYGWRGTWKTDPRPVTKTPKTACHGSKYHHLNGMLPPRGGLHSPSFSENRIVFERPSGNDVNEREFLPFQKLISGELRSMPLAKFTFFPDPWARKARL